MKHTHMITTAIVALVVGIGIGYAGAHAFAKPAARTQGQFTQGNFTRGGMGGNGFISGTVASEDANSITINTRDGSSHVVLLTSGTAISKSVSGTAADITVGSTVMVSGTNNSDGSFSATTVDLRPTPAQKPAQ